MQPGTIGIVLVAAVAHAIWNTVSKYKRGDTFLFVWAYTCGAALVCLPFGLIPVFGGAQPISWQLGVGALVSAGFHVVYSLTLQTGYDRSDLGVVYPVARGTGPVLTMLFAIVLLAERPGWFAVLGAAVVVIGVAVVAGNPFRGGRRPVQGVLWGAATGVSIAGYTLWDSYSVTGLHLDPVTYLAANFLLEGLLLTPQALRRRAGIPVALRSNRGPILTVSVLSPFAYGLVLIAMRTAPVALVAPLRESSIVVGSLLAWRLFHEQHLARRIAGAVIVLGGIAAISL